MDGAKLQQFKDVTGSTDEEAKFYLESHNWNVELATATFFGPQQSSANNLQPTTQPVQNPIAQTVASSNKKKTTAGPSIKGFSDYKEDEEEDKDDKVRWFTGGEKSGIQVEAPKNKDQIIDDVMKEAQKQGAKGVNEFNKEAFHGSGYRLGATKSSAPHQPSVKETRKVITLWKNGFSVDNEPVREYNNPANIAFMNAVKSVKFHKNSSTNLVKCLWT